MRGYVFSLGRESRTNTIVEGLGDSPRAFLACVMAQGSRMWLLLPHEARHLY